MRRVEKIIWGLGVCACLALGLQAEGLEKRYHDLQNGFGLRYPASWSVKGQPRSRGLIKADLVSRDKLTGLQIRIYKNRFSDFPKFVAWYITQFEKDMAYPEQLSRQGKTIAGYEGCMLSFDGRRRNGYFLMSHLLSAKDRVFVFQSGTPFHSRYVYEPIIDRIVESFSLD
jgi:hypothetical protein